MSWKWILIILLLIFLIIFTMQNCEVVTIQFLFWSFQTSRTIIIFVALLMGIIIGFFISFKKREKNKGERL